MSGNQSGGFCHVPCLLSDIFAFICSPGVAPKQSRVVEDGVPTVAAPSDMEEPSRRVGGTWLQSPEEIPVGEPIVPPYNGSKVLPVARLLHVGKTTGVSLDAVEVEESSDSLLEEIRALPPPFECYHGEQLEDDPQLTAENMKKFQAVVREFTKFSVVSIIVEYFFLLWIYLYIDCVVAANGQSVIFEVSEAESD